MFDLIVLRRSQDSNIGMDIEKAINGRYFCLNLAVCFVLSLVSTLPSFMRHYIDSIGSYPLNSDF